jgi:hypothetical protein
LTRSLSDFAKLVELFDQTGVSFVSVTPHDEVEPCDRNVGKEYKTEKPKGEGERRDNINRGAFQSQHGC